MIIESLKQKGEIGEQKDGMDISICMYNKETSELEFSGANNPLYLIRKMNQESVPCNKQFEYEDNILYEIKGDRMPISISDRMDSFNRQTIKLLKGDRLFLFSDGICDQFGGCEGRKFMINSLKEALFQTLTPEIKYQKQLLEDKIDKWQSFISPATGHPYSQIDDICLMGIKF
jgi:serine phosphatase RsbU (regulator of sigma subunit)